MADSTVGPEPPRKRVKLEDSFDTQTNHASTLTSLARVITPPERKDFSSSSIIDSSQTPALITKATSEPKMVPSPFQLTTIRDLPTALNADSVKLKDILSDPLISECWEFNYLHDLDLLMGAFDPDIRDLVKVHVVHGFWKQEDGAGLKVQFFH
jgi:tyrosyl-DNA phosphodiesterase-1